MLRVAWGWFGSSDQVLTAATVIWLCECDLINRDLSDNRLYHPCLADLLGIILKVLRPVLLPIPPICLLPPAHEFSLSPSGEHVVPLHASLLSCEIYGGLPRMAARRSI